MADLYARPAFMIRRAHQISNAVFAEVCAELDLTPSQYVAMFALRQKGAMGQNQLGRSISLDRSTTAVVVKGLCSRGLAVSEADPLDKRKTKLVLSDAGRLLLNQADKLSSKASKQLLSVFDEKEAEAFLGLLERLTTAFEPPPGAEEELTMAPVKSGGR